MMHSRYRIARKFLIFWCLFIGVGAVGGAVGMLSDPTGRAMGMDAMLPYFQVLPFAEHVFQDFLFSGFALLIVNGLTNLTTAGLLFAKKPAGVVLGGLFGVTLMLWICIQFVIFPLNFMSTIYFFFGLAQAATGWAAWVFRKQESFTLSEADYPRIGENPRRAVVYFSRLGPTRRAAMEAANASGAQLFELKTPERTQGTPGFWWCGRFGMHGWPMPVEPMEQDWSAFDHVTLVTPIWVFSISAPMRGFCGQARGIREADYILVHFQRCRYVRAAREMDRLLGREHTPVTSFCCRVGKIFWKKEFHT